MTSKVYAAKSHESAPALYVLKKDGHIRAERATYNQCLKIMHDLTGCSWHHAMKYEGWTIEIEKREV